jgi:hypothetical protein
MDSRSASDSPFVPYGKSLSSTKENSQLSKPRDNGNTDHDLFVRERYPFETPNDSRPPRSFPFEQFTAPRVFEVESVAAPEPFPASETNYYEIVGDSLMPMPLTDNIRLPIPKTPLINNTQPDRSYELETVVLRETFIWSPTQSPRSADDEQSLQPSQIMQKLKDEIRRVTIMLNMTTNEEVRKSCLARISRLRVDFLEAQDTYRTPHDKARPQFDVAPESLKPQVSHTRAEFDTSSNMLPSPSLDRHSDEDRYQIEVKVRASNSRGSRSAVLGSLHVCLSPLETHFYGGYGCN